MEITFVGHQTWLVESNDTRIIVDPILEDSMGAGNILDIQIYPPRVILPSKQPKFTAIFLSHEHADHFDLATLNKLERNIPIYVGPLMTNSVTEAIKKLGFEVIRQVPYTPVEFKDLSVSLYPAGSDTAFWESRVYQFLIEEVKNYRQSVFIAVDALISERYMEELELKVRTIPTCIALSNNSQLTPAGVFGALENMKSDPYQTPSKVGFEGVRVLTSLLDPYIGKDLAFVKNVLICGSGFVKNYEAFGRFPLSDQYILAEAGEKLFDGRFFCGPKPGQKIVLSSDGSSTVERVEWIEIDQKRMNKILGEEKEFLKTRKVSERNIPLVEKSNLTFEDQISETKKALNSLVKPLKCSRQFKNALKCFVSTNFFKIMILYSRLEITLVKSRIALP